jgi:hypothetical protein
MVLRSDKTAVRCLWCRAGHYQESGSSRHTARELGLAEVELECDECGNLQRFRRVDASREGFLRAVADSQVWPPSSHK